MLSESKLNELALAEEMAYLRADLCIYSPESFTLQGVREAFL